MKDNYNFQDFSKEWIASKKLSIKQSSYQRYEDCLNHHIIPILGHIMMEHINDNDISEYFSIKKKTLAKTTLKMSKYIIYAVVEYAKEYVNVPKLHFEYINLNSQSLKEKVLSQDDYVYLVNYAIEHKTSLCICILLGLYTGIRIGELCALQWKDIDFKQECLYISKTIIRLKNNDKYKKTVLTLTTPKTNTSIRCVPIPSFVLEILKEYKGQANDEYYICSNKEKYLDPNTIQKSFKKLILKLKLNKDYHFHTLRHTYGTNCIMLNMDVKSVCEMMGHSNISITLALYVHTSYEYKKEQVNRFTAPD